MLGAALGTWRVRAAFAFAVLSTIFAIGGGTAMAASPPACSSSDVSSISSNFNGTPIMPGHVVWFNAVFTVSGLPSNGATIRFENQSITGIPGFGSVIPPNSYITFSSTATSATTTFDTTQNAWITTIPLSTGPNYFLGGVPVEIPAGTNGGGTPTWSGTFVTTTSGLSVQWQWAAATYNPGFPTSPADYNNIGVTSYDGQLSGRHAGTPANQLGLKDGGGATGGGGSNYTGSYSGTASFTPCGPTPPTIYLGYADSYPVRPIQPNFPAPWDGSPSTFDPSQTVLFVGCGFGGSTDNCPIAPTTNADWYDAGSIRIDNPKTGDPLTFTGTGSSVTIGVCTYTPWNGITATDAPGQTMILTQTGGPDPCGPQVTAHTGINVVPLVFPNNENLDTSESYAQSQNYLNYVQGGPPVCSNDLLVPTATLQINSGTATITDNDQIMNNAGTDLGGPICGVTFRADSTSGSDVLTNVQTPAGGTTGLVVNAAVTGAAFANGFTTGIAITAVNPAADTITVSESANASQVGLILQELFSESSPWSTVGVSVSAPSGFARDAGFTQGKRYMRKGRALRERLKRETHRTQRRLHRGRARHMRFDLHGLVRTRRG